MSMCSQRSGLGSSPAIQQVDINDRKGGGEHVRIHAESSRYCFHWDEKLNIQLSHYLRIRDGEFSGVGATRIEIFKMLNY